MAPPREIQTNHEIHERGILLLRHSDLERRRHLLRAGARGVLRREEYEVQPASQAFTSRALVRAEFAPNRHLSVGSRAYAVMRIAGKPSMARARQLSRSMTCTQPSTRLPA